MFTFFIFFELVSRSKSKKSWYIWSKIYLTWVGVGLSCQKIVKTHRICVNGLRKEDKTGRKVAQVLVEDTSCMICDTCYWEVFCTCCTYSGKVDTYFCFDIFPVIKNRQQGFFQEIIFALVMHDIFINSCRAVHMAKNCISILEIRLRHSLWSVLSTLRCKYILGLA